MKLNILSILLLVSLLLISGAGPVLASDTTGDIDTDADTGIGGVVKAAPTADPPPGVYTRSKDVTLTADGANLITFSFDDWATETEYNDDTSPISITRSNTFQARAYFPDGTCEEDSYTYTIRTSGGGGSGGGDTTPTIYINLDGTTKVITVSDSGAAGQLITVSSPDGKIVLNIPAGTDIEVSGGIPATLSILPNYNPPAPPAGQNILGIAYKCTPTGITFTPPITLTWYLGSLPAGVSASGLKVAFYNTSTAKWETVPATYNSSTGSITATISHFTDYAVLAPATSTATPILSATPKVTATPSPSATVLPAALMTPTASVSTSPTATQATATTPASTTTAPASTEANPEKKTSMNTGIIIIIVIVCLAVIAAIILVIRKRRS